MTQEYHNKPALDIVVYNPDSKRWDVYVDEQFIGNATDEDDAKQMPDWWRRNVKGEANDTHDLR